MKKYLKPSKKLNVIDDIKNCRMQQVAKVFLKFRLPLVVSKRCILFNVPGHYLRKYSTLKKISTHCWFRLLKKKDQPIAMLGWQLTFLTMYWHRWLVSMEIMFYELRCKHLKLKHNRKVKPKPPNTKQKKIFLPWGFLRCLLGCPLMVARF